MIKLSIIIPCFNSRATLQDAVESVYRQDSPIPFDVTFVDDGSTDGTHELMQELAVHHQGIRIVRHLRNQGGGAARNAGIRASDGDLVFCLDSDDMLGPEFLGNLTRFWQSKRCDAVGISKSIKFRGHNSEDVAYVTEFSNPGKPVRFDSLLDRSDCSLYSTFLMTRRGWKRAGGYPTHHGFDTQGMAFRCLGNGLTAYTCPKTTYLHRVRLNESYYLREQKADRINWNWFQVIDEFLYLFNPGVKSQVLNADLFAVPGRPSPQSLFDMLAGRNDIYARNYRELIRLGREGVAGRFRSAADGFHQYWMGSYELHRGRAWRALQHFERAVKAGVNFRMVHLRLLESALRAGGATMSTEAALEELLLYARPYPVEKLPFHERVFKAALQSPSLRGSALALKRLYRSRRSGRS